MTYKDILEKIAKMTPEQQESNPAVLLMNTDEVIPVLDFVDNWDTTATEKRSLGIDQVDGILDEDHPFFTIDF